MKRSCKWVLRFIFWSYTLSFGFFLFDKYFFDIILATQPKRTYIQNIKGTPDQIKQVNEALNIFNTLTPINIIPKKGSRPITITVINDYFWNNFSNSKTLGQAFVGFDSCNITLASRRLRNPKDFAETVIHEYLHCFGYKHVDKLDDLMYKNLNAVHPNSMNEYADDLGDRLK